MAADRTAHPVKDGVGVEPPVDEAAANEPAVAKGSAGAKKPPAEAKESAVANAVGDQPTAAAQSVAPLAGHAESGEEAVHARRVRNVLVGVLAGLFVIALVGAAILGQRVAAAQNEERLRTEAVHAARQLVVNFTTVDHRSFDKSTKGVLALSAGDFRQQYANASKELEQLVKENKTVSSGKVLYAGVVSFDPDSARVLVVADADVTNVAADKPQLRTYRLQLDLSREPDGWRVVDLSFVG